MEECQGPAPLKGFFRTWMKLRIANRPRRWHRWIFLRRCVRNAIHLSRAMEGAWATPGRRLRRFLHRLFCRLLCRCLLLPFHRHHCLWQRQPVRQTASAGQLETARTINYCAIFWLGTVPIRYFTKGAMQHRSHSVFTTPALIRPIELFLV